MNDILNPGPGWTHAGPAVYDHTSGIRIHVHGFCRLPGGYIIRGCQWPESRELDRFIRINGGNRRRGVMAWGLNKLKAR